MEGGLFLGFPWDRGLRRRAPSSSAHATWKPHIFFAPRTHAHAAVVLRPDGRARQRGVRPWGLACLGPGFPVWSEARFSGSLQRTKHPARRALYARRSARMAENLAAAESFSSIYRPLRFQLGRDGPIIDLGSPRRFGYRAHHAAVLYRQPAMRHRFLVALGA